MSEHETHIEDPCDGVTKGTQTTGDPCNPILTNPFDKDPVSPYQPSGGSLCQNVPAPTGTVNPPTITTAIISHLIHDIVSGCTDSSASNYDPAATTDDGSCTYPSPVYGCTDPTATNYDATATNDNGTCTYASAMWLLKGSCIDGEGALDESGWSVSLSADGSIVAIGAYRNNGVNGIDSGHVRVYQYDGTSWSQLGQDIDGEAPYDYSGKSVSLSADGSILAIGAPGNDYRGSNSGHVRVYQYVASAWSQIGSDIDGEAADDLSGWSVSLSSDGATVAIGARLNNGVNGAFSGHVRVYNYDGSNWNQLGQDIDGEAPGDQSGHSVSLCTSNSGALALAIGAPYNNGNGTSSGHVRVYGFDAGTTTWSLIGGQTVQNILRGEDASDWSGWSVSLVNPNSGNNYQGLILAIGAIGNDGANNDDYIGHVRVYTWNGSNAWIKVGQDIDGEAAGDKSGTSVSLSTDGGTLAIGARNNDGNTGIISDDRGHVRVYKNMGNVWTQVGLDIDGEAADDYSGASVSLSADGSCVAIGAYGNDGNGSNAGHACVYHWPN